jgi:hypothetical protein
MTIYRNIHRFCIVFCALLLAGGSVIAQEITVTGIGLTGSTTGLDVEIRPGDSIYVIVSYEADGALDVRGVSIGEANPNRTRLFFYSSALPRADSLVSNAVIQVDSASVEIDSISIPHLVRFGIRSPAGLSEEIASLQIQLGLYAENTQGTVVHSGTWVSHIIQSGNQATGDPIDEGHETFLHISHDVDNRPVIHEPAYGDTVGRFLTIDYDQPVNALPGSVTIQFTEPNAVGILQYHTCFLHRIQRGNSILLDLDLQALHTSAGVDSIQGFAALNDDSLYQIRMGYILEDGRLSDSAFVQIVTDLETEPVQLMAPGLGAFAPYPDIPLLYRLGEAADTVWIIFEMDSLSSTVDALSPHVLTLSSEANAAGLHDFVLDGNNIGWSNPLVAYSNRGPLDSLERRTVYNVTIQCGDRFGNSNAVATNRGYIWPRDNVTISPAIIYPRNNTADNRSLWVEFNLPEAPQAGSVRIYLDSEDPYPISEYVIFLENLAAAGRVAFMLNGLSLDHSGPPVTRIDGGNSLLDGVLYYFTIIYQDYLGNPAGYSSRYFYFDDSTEPPVVYEPLDNDTLHLNGTDLVFAQPEYSIRGTAQIVLTQSGGEEVDLLSPRILYLSDTSIAPRDNPRLITIQPAFLNLSAGVDSIHNGGSLLRRATYDLTVRYQDTLSNAVGEYTVRNLYFPSGSNVTVRGAAYDVQIQANSTQQEAFMLAIKAEGESSLRRIEFEVEGTVVPSDIRASRVVLWLSVDSLFSPAQDTPIDTLDYWFGGPMRFDSLALPLSPEEKFLLVTLSYTAQANSTNSIGLVLRDEDGIDCGGDPVSCTNCPIGGGDVPLSVEVVSLFTEQHHEFGALKLIWDVASEWNNEGFNVWRRQEGDSVFAQIASFTDHSELYGRGTAAMGARYQYIDRNLIPGDTYIYHLQTVSIGGFETQMVNLEASGSPQLPPSSFVLKDAYPNPFNPATTIEYVVPYVAEVQITIYDILGHTVRELVRAQLAPAIYQSIWDGTDDKGMNVPSGVYFYQMVGGQGIFRESRKILLIR